MHYYFGSQEGLLEEILRRHLEDMSARVNECTAALCTGREGSPEAIRDAIAALAIPFAEKLGDERGRRFIRIMAQVFEQQGRFPEAHFVPSSALSMDLPRRSLSALTPTVREERVWQITRFVVSCFEMATAAYLAEAPTGDFWPSNWPAVGRGPE